MPTLSQLRNELDQLDIELIHALAKRIQKGKEIQAFKQAEGLPIEDKQREKAVLQAIKKHWSAYNLPPQCIDALYTVIFQEVKRVAPEKRKK